MAERLSQMHLCWNCAYFHWILTVTCLFYISVKIFQTDLNMCHTNGDMHIIFCIIIFKHLYLDTRKATIISMSGLKQKLHPPWPWPWLLQHTWPLLFQDLMPDKIPQVQRREDRPQYFDGFREQDFSPLQQKLLN